MKGATELYNDEDLAFFGKVNASISHELKNIFAVISETAGLLNDLMEMAADGKALDREEIKTCSKDIIEEIQRGFVAVKQMNRFSHSVDDPFKSVNLVEMLNLIIGLAGFLSFASTIHFDSQDKMEPEVFTSPFRLENLLYQAFVFAFESVGPEGDIYVDIQSEQTGKVRITFSGLGPMGLKTFPTDKATLIAETIDAQIHLQADSQAFDILLPMKAG